MDQYYPRKVRSMDKNIADWLEAKILREAPVIPVDAPSEGETEDLELDLDVEMGPEVDIEDLENPPEVDQPELQEPSVSEDPAGEDEPIGDEEPPSNREGQDVGEEVELLDFDDFRQDYIEMSVNAKPEELMDKLGDLSGIIDLGPKEKKFTSDNLQILQLMEDKDIYEASRKLHHIEDPMEMMAQLSETIDKVETLRNVTFKLTSFFGMKSDLYRKFVASLLGAVQVGGGGTVEDLVIAPTKGQRTLLCTRFYTVFGYIDLVPWSLHEGDADMFLKDIERERMETGSPEEKRVLLKRTILSSITNVVGNKIFLVCVVSRSTGRRTEFAFRMDRFLNQGYEKGLLEVNLSEESDRLEVFPDGSTRPPAKLQIKFVDPEGEDKEFIEWMRGSLYMTAEPETIETLADLIGESFYNRTDFEGDEEELETAQNCIPTLPDMLLRRC